MVSGRVLLQHSVDYCLCSVNMNHDIEHRGAIPTRCNVGTRHIFRKEKTYHSAFPFPAQSG